jgi:hypothetical protein
MLILTDTASANVVITIAIQESLTLLDQLYTGLEIQLTDTIDMNDTLSVAISTQLQEIITITDQLLTITDFTLISTETLHLLDMMKKAVNGVCDKR